MTSQSTSIIEPLIAVLADVGLGGLVLALVAAQVGGHGGAEPALVATERLLACVLAHVDLQVTSLCKAPPTEVAQVLLIPVMYLHVGLQYTLYLEPHTALVTGVWSDIGVRTRMARELLASLEALAARRTCEFALV